MSSAKLTRIAVAIVKADEHFVIGQRPPDVPLAGYWEFPGGKMLPGESPLEAAARECFEETGIAVQAIDEYQTVIHEYAHGVLELHFVNCRLLEKRAAARLFAGSCARS